MDILKDIPKIKVIYETHGAIEVPVLVVVEPLCFLGRPNTEIDLLKLSS